jgi:hypothetical protein
MDNLVCTHARARKREISPKLMGMLQTKGHTPIKKKPQHIS